MSTRSVWIGIALVAACGGGSMSGGGSAGPMPSMQQLQAVQRWEVVQLPGISVLPETDPPTLRFGDDDRVSGRTGCNQFSGGFTRTDAAFTFTQMVATKMACPGSRMEVESTYLAALNATRRLSLSDQALSLLGEDGTLLARLVPAEG